MPIKFINKNHNRIVENSKGTANGIAKEISEELPFKFQNKF